MDLAEKFKMAAVVQTAKITSLNTDISYPIVRAERFMTRYGESVLLTLQDTPHTFMKVFLPRRYGAVFTDDDIKAVNEKTVSLILSYRGICPTLNSPILEIH
jgi:hypothetical protein